MIEEDALEDQRISVVWLSIYTSWSSVVHQCWVYVQRDETQTVCEDFVMNDRRIIPYIYVFDCQRRYLRAN